MLGKYALQVGQAGHVRRDRPGTNGPPAFGNIVMALGLVEHDSRVVGIGMAVTLAGCVFATVVLSLLGWGIIAALGWML